MVDAVVAMVLRDNGLSDTAARMALLVASKGEGWHEIAPAEFARAVAGYPSHDTIRRHLKQLEMAGYVERKAGGRGHSDSFRVSVHFLDSANDPNLKLNRVGIQPEPKTLDSANDPNLKSGHFEDRLGKNAESKNLDSTYDPNLNAYTHAEVVVDGAVFIPPSISPPLTLDERAESAIADHDTLLAGCRGALRDYVAAYVPTPTRQYAYIQTVATWLDDGDPNVWRLPDGSSLPKAQRPAMLAAALNELAAGDERTMKRRVGDPGNLRTKINILLRKWGDDAGRPANGNHNRGRAPQGGGGAQQTGGNPNRRRGWSDDG